MRLGPTRDNEHFGIGAAFVMAKSKVLLFLRRGALGGSEYRKQKMTNTALSQKKKKNRQIPQDRKTSKTLSKINEITKLLPCIILKLRANINLIVFSNIKEC